MRMFKNKKGFTLIELMIVVVIIGILAALAIPRFMQASKKAKISEAKNVLKQVYEQSAAYYEEKGAWPTSSTPGYPTNGWLNGGWEQIGVDAPSGKPRFAYQWVNDTPGAPAGTEIAHAYGADKSLATQYYDASLATVELRINNNGVLELTLDGSTWE